MAADDLSHIVEYIRKDNPARPNYSSSIVRSGGGSTSRGLATQM
jgi:hypothetical protein